MTIDTIKIFPPIGIARLGNSPPDWPVNREDRGEWFVGPEIPGDHSLPSGRYKDSKFRVKRQAARFRLFAYEAGSTDAKQITLDDADIKWTVELANTKADWYNFGGIEHTNLPLRNPTVTDRASLRITPGPRTLDSTEPFDEHFFERPTKIFNTGAFHGVPVSLGEMQTDADGHLLVLGGFGKSASPHNTPIQHFANNDDWYDDISDGPVNASVRLKGTNAWIQASSAWVICAPPKFAPPIEHIITLYDTLLQVAVDRHMHGVESLLPSEPPSFTNDIYPLLVRAMNMRWVIYAPPNSAAMHPSIQKILPLSGHDDDVRQRIFSKVRDPSLPTAESSGKIQNMPKIWSDVYNRDSTSTAMPPNQALTKIQHHTLEQWKDGIFKDGSSNPQAPETQISPGGLTRAALEACVGGAFFPGIETSYMTRDNYAFVEPFRLDAAQLMPGDLTKQMAIPWQADFFDCGYERPLYWWPAYHPHYVFTPSGSQQPWIRDEDNINKRVDFIARWHKLGFVVQQGDQYVETERNEL